MYIIKFGYIFIIKQRVRIALLFLLGVSPLTFAQDNREELDKRNSPTYSEPLFVKFTNTNRKTKQFKEDYHFLKKAASELGGKFVKTLVSEYALYVLLDFSELETTGEIDLAWEILKEAPSVESIFPAFAFNLYVYHLGKLETFNNGQAIPDRTLYGLKTKMTDFQPDLDAPRVPGEIIIKYLEELPGESPLDETSASMMSFKTRTGTKTKRVLGTKNGKSELIEFSTDSISMEEALNELNAIEELEYAEPNYIVQLALPTQENATFIVQGEIYDVEGFPISESYLLPLANSVHIARARGFLTRKPDEPGWEDRRISATIELSDDESNRNYNIPGRPAWSWRIKNFEGFFSDTRLHAFNPTQKHTPSGIEEDPEAWIAANGNRVDFYGYYIVAELLEAAKTEFVNLSTRGFVGSGESVLIAGIIIPKGATKTVLIRGLGPSLAERNVENFLEDPRITVYDGYSVIAQNDNWQEGQSIEPFNSLSEGLLPTRDQESALLITLSPGLYTIHLESAPKSTTSGIGLIEVFDMDE